jgi:hypothetical protein
MIPAVTSIVAPPESSTSSTAGISTSSISTDAVPPTATPEVWPRGPPTRIVAPAGKPVTVTMREPAMYSSSKSAVNPVAPPDCA